MHCLSKNNNNVLWNLQHIYRSKMYAISSSKDESDALGMDHCKVYQVYYNWNVIILLEVAYDKLIKVHIVNFRAIYWKKTHKNQRDITNKPIRDIKSIYIKA